MMPNFTRPDGSTLTLSPTDRVRARPSFGNEIDGHPGHDGTALHKPLQLVMEPVAAVGAAMAAERASWIALSGLSNRALWFDATEAKDAEAPRGHEAGNGANAIIPVGGVRLRVLESVAEAQAAIDTARAAV